jgi:hypothetical protein
VSKVDCGAHERLARAFPFGLVLSILDIFQILSRIAPFQLWLLTDPGMLAIIYGGASGAMQSFHRRGMKQDELLRIIAYVRTLDK